MEIFLGFRLGVLLDRFLSMWGGKVLYRSLRGLLWKMAAGMLGTFLGSHSDSIMAIWVR